MNEELVGNLLRSMDLPRLTIDIDGSVLSNVSQTEGAKRGYNPHRSKVRGYYTISELREAFRAIHSSAQCGKVIDDFAIFDNR